MTVTNVSLLTAKPCSNSCASFLRLFRLPRLIPRWPQPLSSVGLQPLVAPFERIPVAPHIGDTNLFSVSPGYPLHSDSGDQRHPRRLRALLAGLARPDRTTATPARARRLRGPDLPRPR